MTTESTQRAMLEELKKELREIKRNMVTKDELLSREEYAAYKRSFNKEELITLEELKKELGL